MTLGLTVIENAGLLSITNTNVAPLKILLRQEMTECGRKSQSVWGREASDAVWSVGGRAGARAGSVAAEPLLRTPPGS